MGNTKKLKVYKRRLAVKKDYLKGMSIPELAEKYGVSESVIKRDIKKINEEYIAAVQKNPYILERQAEYILRHLDELKMIKEKLWEIEEKASDKEKIAALKAILDELHHEARVLKLIDVSKTINNYIHIDKIEIVLNKVIDIIKEFVPLEKQEIALERLKNIGETVFREEERR